MPQNPQEEVAGDKIGGDCLVVMEVLEDSIIVVIVVVVVYGK